MINANSHWVYPVSQIIIIFWGSDICVKMACDKLQCQVAETKYGDLNCKTTYCVKFKKKFHFDVGFTFDSSNYLHQGGYVLGCIHLFMDTIILSEIFYVGTA